MTPTAVKYLPVSSVAKIGVYGKQKLIQMINDGIIEGGQITDKKTMPYFVDMDSYNEYVKNNPNPPVEQKKEKVKKDVQGPLIYFIQAGEDGFVKIGYTKQFLIKRRSELQTGCPVPLKILGYIKPATIEFEKYFHEHFGKFRAHGEWFDPVDEIIHNIEYERLDG